jgi:hypothetical protein
MPAHIINEIVCARNIVDDWVPSREWFGVYIFTVTSFFDRLHNEVEVEDEISRFGKDWT